MVRLAAFQPDIAANLGAMIRIAVCFGVPLDVIAPCGFPFSVKAVRRSAMDYADRAEIHHHAGWEAFRAALPGRMILATTAAAVPYWDHRFEVGDTLVMGRESAGVPAEVHAAADRRVLVPMPGAGRSLNVAVTAGILLAEAQRQRLTVLPTDQSDKLP